MREEKEERVMEEDAVISDDGKNENDDDDNDDHTNQNYILISQFLHYNASFPVTIMVILSVNSNDTTV